jgi:hypothetical protein
MENNFRYFVFYRVKINGKVDGMGNTELHLSSSIQNIKQIEDISRIMETERNLPMYSLIIENIQRFPI